MQTICKTVKSRCRQLCSSFAQMTRHRKQTKDNQHAKIAHLAVIMSSLQYVACTQHYAVCKAKTDIEQQKKITSKILRQREGGEICSAFKFATQPRCQRAGLRRRRARVQIAVVTLSGNSLRQTVHAHRACVHQAAKFVAALLRVAGVTAGLAESNGSLPPGL